MARISVYIPDELLEQARNALSKSASGSKTSSRSRSVSGSGPDSENTSQLVQRGLQSLIEREERVPGYAQSPADAQEEIAQLRERLMTEARQDYEVGYKVALEAASAMSLHTINSLVDANFDLQRWLAPFKSGYTFEAMRNMESIDPVQMKRLLLDKATVARRDDDWWRTDPWGWLFKTAEALGNVADPIGYDPYSFAPTKARERGFVDAMRELWAALEEPKVDRHQESRDLDK